MLETLCSLTLEYLTMYFLKPSTFSCITIVIKIWEFNIVKIILSDSQTIFKCLCSVSNDLKHLYVFIDFFLLPP